jgi:hypothetical protein
MCVCVCVCVLCGQEKAHRQREANARSSGKEDQAKSSLLGTRALVSSQRARRRLVLAAKHLLALAGKEVFAVDDTSHTQTCRQRGVGSRSLIQR